MAMADVEFDPLSRDFFDDLYAELREHAPCYSSAKAPSPSTGALSGAPRRGTPDKPGAYWPNVPVSPSKEITSLMGT